MRYFLILILITFVNSSQSFEKYHPPVFTGTIEDQQSKVALEKWLRRFTGISGASNKDKVVFLAPVSYMAINPTGKTFRDIFLNFIQHYEYLQFKNTTFNQTSVSPRIISPILPVKDMNIRYSDTTEFIEIFMNYKL